MKLKNKRYLKIIIYILFIIWIITLFGFSNEQGEESTSTSKKVLEVVERIIKKVNPNNQIEVDNLHYIIRKYAHYMIYIIGGILISSIIQLSDLKTKESLLLPIFVGILISILDELHQYLIPGRTSSVTDVYIDTLGIITGILLLHVILNICNSSIRGSKNEL